MKKILIICFVLIFVTISTVFFIRYKAFLKECNELAFIVSTLYPSFFSNYYYCPENIQQFINHGLDMYALNNKDIKIMEKHPVAFIEADSGICIVRLRRFSKKKIIDYQIEYSFFDHIMNRGYLLYWNSLSSPLEWIWGHHPHSSIYFKNTQILPDEERMKLREDFVDILKVSIEHNTSAIFYKSLIHYNQQEMKVVEHEDSLKNTQLIDVLLKEIHEQSKQLFKQYEVDSAYFFMNFPNKFELKQPVFDEK